MSYCLAISYQNNKLNNIDLIKFYKIKLKNIKTPWVMLTYCYLKTNSFYNYCISHLDIRTLFYVFS